jgi:hypothetical protein
MEKLKVGDKIYIAETSRWSKRINYVLDEVVRLTKKQAVLSKGRKIINEPTTEWNNKETCFSEYGDRYRKWFLQTEEVLIKVKAEKERQFIEQWFSNKKFTDEEQKLVYVKFKELNLLDNVAPK